jgi:hypothetical protein
VGVQIHNPAGRLITYRVVSPVDDDNAARAAIELRQAVLAVEGRVIICTDLTEARTFRPSTSEAFLNLMKNDNPKLERSAILVGDHSATLFLQLERMIREAQSPVRRAFHQAAELIEWLRPQLVAAEQAALEAFLAAGRTG